MKINGFHLPPNLEHNLESKGCINNYSTSALKELLTKVDRPDPKLFDLDQIVLYNRFWETEQVSFYLGVSSNVNFPGNVDPRQALIIGEAEPDSPIALDYRSDPPRVIYYGDAEGKCYWFELASSYEVFMEAIENKII